MATQLQHTGSPSSELRRRIRRLKSTAQWLLVDGYQPSQPQLDAFQKATADVVSGFSEWGRLLQVQQGVLCGRCARQALMPGGAGGCARPRPWRAGGESCPSPLPAPRPAGGEEVASDNLEVVLTAGLRGECGAAPGSKRPG